MARWAVANARQQRQDGAAENPEQQEHLHPRERVVDVGQGAGIEQRGVPDRLHVELAHRTR